MSPGRALRLGLLPPPAADVRQDRARHRLRGLRGPHRADQADARHVEQDTDLTPPTWPCCAALQDRSSRTRPAALPAGPARAARRRRRGRLPVLGWRARRLYRRQERIPHDLGTAVNVQTMVFGNMSDDSGTGVCFTRDPSTGDEGCLRRLPHERPGRGRRRRHPQRLPRCRVGGRVPDAYALLLRQHEAPGDHYRDLCDIEFTIERGKLWMLQTRVGKRTAEAAFRIAGQLIDEGVITEEEALTRVTGAQLSNLMFPRFDASANVGAAHQGCRRPARARPSARSSSARPRPRSGPTAARTSSSCAPRPTPTTWSA
jgi:hypothetical protein